MRDYNKLMALLMCLIILSLAGCSGKRDLNKNSEAGKVAVVATFNAMKEFAEAVGGDKIEVATVIPDGMEPHDFEPKAQDLAALSRAKVFIYNGLGMEPWAEEAIAAAKNDSLIAVDASDGADAIETSQAGEKEHGKYDPHLWLSLKGAEIEAQNIKDGLIKADPENKDYYEANCSNYVEKLEKLYKTYCEKLEGLNKKSFVTGHAAFAYLCRDFGLTQKSVEDVFAEGEPGPRQLAELADYCREENVTVIFAEKMVSPEVSRTLAEEIGAKVDTIYTMASAEDGKSYLERMEDNLNKIYASLSE